MSDFEELSKNVTVTSAPAPAPQPTGIDNPTRPELDLPDHASALFTILGRRWSPHLLYLLGQRPARFTELQKAIPRISATSLNDRLHALVHEGLVARHISPGPPLSSTYQATPAGQLIAECLMRMAADSNPALVSRQPWRP